MATLTTRLEKLEGAQADAATPARLLIIARYDAPDDTVIGLRGGGPRLPDDVLRLPDETLKELQTRAAAMVKGPGPLLCGYVYADDTCLTD